MPLRQFFAHSYRQLSETCVIHLHREARETADPFVAPWIIIPHRQARLWLQHVYTQRHRAAMNLRFEYLEDGLWALARMAGDDTPRIDRGWLRHAVLKEIMTLLDAESPGPLRKHFRGDDPSSPAHAKKLWQLADRLTFLFLEYTYQYPSMTSDWLAGRNHPMDPIARLQMDIYREVFGGAGVSALPNPRRWKHKEKLPKRVTIYAPTPLARLPLIVLAELSREIRIDIYQMKPPEKGAGDEVSNWAAALRRSEAILAEVITASDPSGIASVDLPTGRNPATLLTNLQGVILGERSAGAVTLDDSLEMASAAGVMREVHAAHQSIINRLDSDPTLLQTDIAVVLPRDDSYESAVHSIFAKDCSPLGYNMPRASVLRESVWSQGVLALLDLLSGEATRAGVFALFNNPCFCPGIGGGESDRHAWLELIQQAGVYRYLDNDHLTASGEDGDGRFTWHRGMQRMRLAMVMDSPRDQLLDLSIHPISSDGADIAAVGSLSLVVERLRRARRETVRADIAASEWVEWFLDLVDCLLSIPEDRGEEDSVRRSFRIHLLGIRGSADIQSEVWPFHLFYAVVVDSLGNVRTSKGTPLHGGVTVGHPEELRGIPFRVVYTLGLNSGLFPARATPDGLDLRTRLDPDIVHAPTDRDRLAFLELLLAAEDAFIGTWQGRDLKKDEELFASSVVSQLQDIVDDHFSLKIPLMEVPWHGHSPGWRDDQQRGTFSRNHDPLDLVLLAGAADDPIETDSQTISSPQPTAERLRIRLSDIAKFLEDPIEDFLRRHMNLWNESTAMTSPIMEKEPLSLGPVHESQILRELLYKVAGDPSITDDTLLGMLESAITLAGHQSLLAGGNFEERAFTRAWNFLKEQAAWVRQWRATHAGSRLMMPLVLGDYPEHEPHAACFPPVILNLDGQQVEIVGKIPLVSVGERGDRDLQFIILRPASSHSDKITKSHLPAILTQMILAAGRDDNDWIEGSLGSANRALINCLYRPGGKKGLVVTHCSEMTTVDAQSNMKRIIGAFVSAKSPLLLPFAVVTEEALFKDLICRDDVAPVELEEAVEEDLSGWHPSWFPSDLASALNASAPEVPCATAQERLGFLAPLILKPEDRS